MVRGMPTHPFVECRLFVGGSSCDEEITVFMRVK